MSWSQEVQFFYSLLLLVGLALFYFGYRFGIKRGYKPMVAFIICLFPPYSFLVFWLFPRRPGTSKKSSSVEFK